MPRRVATQVGEFTSRLVRGGYLKTPPSSLHATLRFPPTPLPPRTTFPKRAFESVEPDAKYWNKDRVDKIIPKSSRKTPRLWPHEIHYLEDRVRERFYNDHPYETLRPRTLVEGKIISDKRVPDPEANDLIAWGRNPGPEDVIACSVHLHKNHGLSLSQAYHHTLSSYYALRAEHEHASRIAVFEARAYGATFGQSSDRKTSAPEIERGFDRESEELLRGAQFLATRASGVQKVNQSPESIKPKRPSRSNAKWNYQRGGKLYLRDALQLRDGIWPSYPEELDEKENSFQSIQDSTPFMGILSTSNNESSSSSSSSLSNEANNKVDQNE